MKGMYITMKKLSKWKKVIILVVVFIVVCILIDMISSPNKTADTDKKENLADEIKDDQENQEKEAVSAEKYRDGVSDDYQSYSFQMDTNTILQEYYDKGYDNVWLFYHEVKAPENGKIGDGGTVDTISLEASYEDKDGYFYITDTYGVIYAYWNETLGWKNTFEQLEGDSKYDFSKFNNTYWKVKVDERKAELARLVMNDYSGDEDIEVFVSFENFDTFRYLGNHEFASDAVLGELLVVSNEKVYKAEFTCDYMGYGHKIRLFFNEMATEWRISVQVDIGVNSTAIDWSAGSQSDIEAITKEEFEEASKGMVALDERSDSMQEEANEENNQKMGGNGDYEIIPYETYESGGEDLHMYANLTKNSDGSIDVEGFAYSYGEFLEDMAFHAHFTEGEEDWYGSDDAKYDLIIGDGYISFMGNTVEGKDYSFTGDFSVVTDESY